MELMLVSLASLLAGFVDSNEAKTHAGELAREVSGVTNVRNDLEIRQR